MRHRLSRRRLLQCGCAAALPMPAMLQAQAVDDKPIDYVDVAVRAHRWLERSRIETPNGPIWPIDPLNPQEISMGLYQGSPGVIVFLLQLYDATRSQAYLDEAVSAAHALASAIPDKWSDKVDAGLYEGLAGQAFALNEAAQLSGDLHITDAAHRTFELIKTGAQTVGAGVQWSDVNDIEDGTAGTGLFLLQAAKIYSDPSAIDLAAKAGRRLLELGQPTGEPRHPTSGLKWPMSPAYVEQYPNFSHGAAGIGYFLATLYGATGDKAFLDGALKAATYLDMIANKDNGDWRVFHYTPGGEGRYYVGWCHGPSGSARLFQRLKEVAPDDHRWDDYVERCAHAVMDMGVPVKRSAGYWNNISQCCGTAAVGEFFSSLNGITGNKHYLDVARSAARDIVARATEEGGGLKWVQAETRIKPGLLIAQTNYMQGAAGVGSFLLHLHAREQGRKRLITFPDNPFTA